MVTRCQASSRYRRKKSSLSGALFDQPQIHTVSGQEARDLPLGLCPGVPILSTNLDKAHRPAEALFKKEQQLREGQQAMAEYQAELRAMREKTVRLRALRLARDAANQKAPPANRKGVA
jgi:hypothetical protein